MNKLYGDNKDRLDNDRRRELLKPPETLRLLGFKQGMNLADIGCGTGFFSLPASEIGGMDSKIYAVDTSKVMLDEVENKIKATGIVNVYTIKSEGYDFKLGSESVDFVLVSTVLHEIDKKQEFLVEAKRILKPSGKIAIIEFEKFKGEYGPPVSHRISSEEVTELITKAGYINIEKIKIGADFYSVTAQK